MLYQWQKEQWSKILSYKNLPHALLLSGSSGIGKKDFAKHLAQSILCSVDLLSYPHKVPCQKCSSCRLIKASNCPDFYEAEESKGDQILIDTITEIRSFLQQSSHLGGAKVAVIPNAENMNRSSSNALLKILEEPPPNKYIILSSNIPYLMLPTIISRCVRIKFTTPSTEFNKKWLLENFPHINPDLLTNNILSAINNEAPLAIAAMLQNNKAEKIYNFAELLDEPVSKNNSGTLPDLVKYKALDSLDIIDILLYKLDKVIIKRISSQIKNKYSSIAKGDSKYQYEQSVINNMRLFILRDIYTHKKKLILDKLNLNTELLINECLILWRSVVMGPPNAIVSS